MLVIRFRRIGKKGQPTYRIVVAEHTLPLDGKFTADLGAYNPHTKALTLNKDEAVEWMNKGAQPSNSVAKLLSKEKVKHNSVVVIKKTKKPKQIKEKAPKVEAPAVENETSAVVESTESAEMTAETTSGEEQKA